MSYRFYFHFNAMHNIAPDNPKKMHTHTFRIVVYVRGKKEDIEVYNKCQMALDEYLRRFRGTKLNQMPQFKGAIPTIEVIAQVLYDELTKVALESDVDIIKLEVGDSPLSSYCIAKELLVGSVYHRVDPKKYQKYVDRARKQYEEYLVSYGENKGEK